MVQKPEHKKVPIVKSLPLICEYGLSSHPLPWIDTPLVSYHLPRVCRCNARPRPTYLTPRWLGEYIILHFLPFTHQHTLEIFPYE